MGLRIGGAWAVTKVLHQTERRRLPLFPLAPIPAQACFVENGQCQRGHPNEGSNQKSAQTLAFVTGAAAVQPRQDAQPPPRENGRARDGPQAHSPGFLKPNGLLC